MTAAERIFAEALALPEEERVALAERLLAASPDRRVEDAWYEEASRRLTDYKRGAEPALGLDEALSEMFAVGP